MSEMSDTPDTARAAPWGPSAALIAIGSVMFGWMALNAAGTVDALQAYLHPSAYQEHLAPERAIGDTFTLSAFERLKHNQVVLCLLFGSAFAFFGLLHTIAGRRNRLLSRVFAALPGVALIVLIAFVVRWGLDPLLACLGKDAQTQGWLDWNFATLLNLNYILLAMVAGIVVANVLRVPSWAISGASEPSKLFLKAGVIMLGGLYTASELTQLSLLGVMMVGAFIVFSMMLVMALGARLKTSDSMTGVMAAGLSVCGVSAVVATSAVVQARASEIAYTIATILLWGVLGVFLFPLIGHVIGLDSNQLGAWVGTAILDSSQVVGAALAFDSQNLETIKVAGIFNVTRVLFLPVVILWLALWYARRVASVKHVSRRKILLGKFPYFVLGFLAMFALGSTGVLGHTNLMNGAFHDAITWLFTLGLIGLGMQISVDGIKQAGRRPLLIGTIVAGVKAGASLVAVLIFL